MTEDTKHFKKDKLPPPEACGYWANFEGNSLVINIRKTFDHENKGRSWAKPIIECFPAPFASLIVDFGTNKIISSSVYAGLVELYQAFHQRCEDGFHLRNCSPAIERAIKMLHLDSFFTITLQETG